MSNKKVQFKPGQHVIVNNAKKYDSMAGQQQVTGTVDFVWSDGRVAVRVLSPGAVGHGQMNVDAADIVIQEHVGDPEYATDSKMLASKPDLPVTIHKSPYEGAQVGEYTEMFVSSPKTAQQFAKYIIFKGGSARLGKRGQDTYVYHKGAGPISKRDFRMAKIEEGVADPEEGWCLVMANGKVTGNIHSDVQAAKRQQAQAPVATTLKWGKRASDGSDEYVATRAVSPAGEIKEQDVVEAWLDPSGLQAAASMVRDFIITAEVDGKTKKFRIKGMTGPNAAKERFLKYANMAKVLDVKPVQDVVEGGYQDDSKEREENLRYSRSRNPVAGAKIKTTDPEYYRALARKHEQDGQRGTRAGMVYASAAAGRARRAADMLEKGASAAQAFQHYQGTDNMNKGMAENFGDPLTGYHIVYRKTGNVVHATPSFETQDAAQKYLMTKMFANHQDYKVVHTAKIGVIEAPIASNYTPRHSVWLVKPRKQIRVGDPLDGKFFSLSDEQSAREYAAKIGGRLVALDQFLKFMPDVKISEAAYSPDLDETRPVVVRGVRGMQSKPFTKKFKNMAAYDAWSDSSDSDDFTVQQVTNESAMQTTTKKFSLKEALAIINEGSQRLQWHVVSKLDARVLASYETREQAEEHAFGNPVIQGDIEHIGDTAFVKEKDTVEHMEEQAPDQADVICVDVPLFIRLMEYAREDAQSDVDLHKLAEKIVARCADGGCASMNDYDELVQIEDSADSEDSEDSDE